MLNPEASSTLCLPIPNQFLTLLASPSDLLDSFTLTHFRLKYFPNNPKLIQLIRMVQILQLLMRTKFTSWSMSYTMHGSPGCSLYGAIATQFLSFLVESRNPDVYLFICFLCFRDITCKDYRVILSLIIWNLNLLVSTRSRSGREQRYDYDTGLAPGKEDIKIKMETMFQEVGTQPQHTV